MSKNTARFQVTASFLHANGAVVLLQYAEDGYSCLPLKRIE